MASWAWVGLGQGGKCAVKEMFVSTLSDVPLWSKLQSGYVPNIQEIFKILDSQLKIKQVDQMSS